MCQRTERDKWSFMRFYLECVMLSARGCHCQINSVKQDTEVWYSMAVEWTHVMLISYFTGTFVCLCIRSTCSYLLFSLSLAVASSHSQTLYTQCDFYFGVFCISLVWYSGMILENVDVDFSTTLCSYLWFEMNLVKTVKIRLGDNFLFLPLKVIEV